MSAHQPIRPAKAVALAQARNLDRPDALLADFAAAGLIKTYALAREISPAGGPTEIIRDAQIPPGEWKRIVESDNIQIALNGRTVRLEGSPLQGGLPSVLITGIRFSEASLTKILDRYCVDLSGTSDPPQKHTPTTQNGSSKPSLQGRKKRQKAVPSIKAGDLTASVAQAMQATGLGRTKIDQLMQKGELVRTKVGNRALISVESIERLVGAKVAE